MIPSSPFRVVHSELSTPYVPPPPVRALGVHPGVTCDVCGASPLQGVRHKCLVCPDVDLCATCVAKAGERHPRTHPTLALYAPVHPEWEALLPRVLFPLSLLLPLETLDATPGANAAAQIGAVQDALAAAAGLGSPALGSAYAAAQARKAEVLHPVSPAFAALLARLRANDATLTHVEARAYPADLHVDLTAPGHAFDVNSPRGREAAKVSSALSLLHAALEDNYTLQELDLSGLSPELRRSWPLRRLRVLNLSGLSLRPAWVMNAGPADWTGVGPGTICPVARELCTELLHNTTLERLVLRDCDICGEVALMLAAALRVNCTLRTLDLGGSNGVGLQATGALVAALQLNGTLQELHVNTLRAFRRDEVLAEWAAQLAQRS